MSSKFDEFYIPALVLHPSGIETGDGSSKVFKFPFGGFVAILDVTASTGSSETLDVTIQEYNQAADAFLEIFTFGLAAADASNERLLHNEDDAAPFGSLIRLDWVLPESSSTFTFSVSIMGKL